VEEVLYLKDEVYRISGCAMAVLNSIGHGFAEKVYENAMAVELDASRIPYERQSQHQIFHRNIEVGIYIPDLIAFGQVVIEMKVIDRITDHERGQLLNYLKVTGLKVGLILNFKHAKLEWQRLVN
jgi:GxxExxY protein